MPSYFFLIRNRPHSNLIDLSMDVANRDAAWTEITKVFSDLVGDVTKGPEQNTGWQIELPDACRKPLFRVRIVADSFEQAKHFCLIMAAIKAGGGCVALLGTSRKNLQRTGGNLPVPVDVRID